MVRKTTSIQPNVIASVPEHDHKYHTAYPKTPRVRTQSQDLRSVNKAYKWSAAK